MRNLVTAIILAALLTASAAWSAANEPQRVKAKNKQEERLVRANEVFLEMMNAPDKGIPEDLLSKAHCAGIIPGVKKVAIFSLGGRHGAGIVTCRTNNGRGAWGAPSAFSISGGSFGLQIGYSDTDFIFLIMNQSGVRKLLESKFTIGADANAAAGPIGRTAEAATDAQLTAEILTYSRSKGIFAGVSLEGAVLRPSPEDNRILYGRDISPKDLLMDSKVPPPAVAGPLLATLNRFSPQEEKRTS